MKTAFKNHLNLSFPELQSHAFILACSGGIDSVVLAHLCADAGLSFALAHCNFNLRGAASAADAHFVEQLAQQLSVPHFATSFDTQAHAKADKVSIQMAARSLRYHWFEDLLKQEAYSYLVTAHHRDDSLETMLINWSRGTGIDGLMGIPEKRDQIRRPLLPFTRQEVASYAAAHDIEWREDSSNKETKYLRNKIRHELLPLLKELHPKALENMVQTQKNLSQTAALSDAFVQSLKKEIWKETATGAKILIAPLRSSAQALASTYALFSPYGFTDPMAVLHLSEGPSGKELRTHTHRLLKDREILCLYSIETMATPAAAVTIDINRHSIESPIAMELLHDYKGLPPEGKHAIVVDASQINFPLQIRHIKEGDVFYPEGMKGKKRLSKYLRDEKINVISKSRIWLLTDAKDQIIWVIGMRADRRFQIDSKTTNRICFKSLV